ncbi:hypothetical protein Vadar_022261 [Vaccinium darrowii]|uniref:Uncharacterized protein n=1 Tax=Vaccinium darrowii TaxID=229202 RepID=A0ACB7Y9I2_9ERIC|nr:hypothetical protein Vadar_022261 [Vaccinium darrowii]
MPSSSLQAIPKFSKSKFIPISLKLTSHRSRSRTPCYKGSSSFGQQGGHTPKQGKGRMVLSFLGRRDLDRITDQQGSFQWELLAQALMSLASEGLVQEETIGSFSVPFYAACPEELKFVVQKEGSFLIDRVETFEIYCDEQIKTEFEKQSSGQRVANSITAIAETML